MGEKRFDGFGEGAIEFFDALENDNSKAFWTEHKQLYQDDVRAPMEALLAELDAEFAPAFGDQRGTGKVFRPYRDVRFSKDKRPYKIQCGAVIEPARGAGAYYVEVSSAGLRIGGGSFRMAPDQLARYRTAVDEARRGEQLRALLDTLTARGWTLGGDRMRTKPRGVDAGHPRLELLQHRTIYVVHTWPPDDTLHERAALQRVRDGWRQLVGLNEWAVDHVGLPG